MICLLNPIDFPVWYAQEITFNVRPPKKYNSIQALARQQCKDEYLLKPVAIIIDSSFIPPFYSNSIFWSDYRKQLFKLLNGYYFRIMVCLTKLHSVKRVFHINVQFINEVVNEILSRFDMSIIKCLRQILVSDMPVNIATCCCEWMRLEKLLIFFSGFCKVLRNLIKYLLIIEYSFAKIFFHTRETAMSSCFWMTEAELERQQLVQNLRNTEIFFTN